MSKNNYPVNGSIQFAGDVAGQVTVGPQNVAGPCKSSSPTPPRPRGSRFPRPR